MCMLVQSICDLAYYDCIFSIISYVPFRRRGAYCFAHDTWLVGQYVSLQDLVLLITQERFASEAHSW